MDNDLTNQKTNCTNSDRITWAEHTKNIFETILEQIPAMVRGIAEVRVRKRAEDIVRQDNRSSIEEKDMIEAFFVETPEGFKPLMRDSMDDLGIDYKKYGYE